MLTGTLAYSAVRSSSSTDLLFESRTWSWIVPPCVTFIVPLFATVTTHGGSSSCMLTNAMLSLQSVS